MTASKGLTIWLTGLSGAGKTTIAHELAEQLTALGRQVEVLDGDVVRTNLSKGLGFSREDRDTNIRRIGFVANLLTRNGVIAIAAAISPYREIRDEVRREIGDFVEVYVQCPLDVLVQRDTKGLYAKAMRGEIQNFTGVSDPYEEPLKPEVVCHTDRETVDESVGKVLAWVIAMDWEPLVNRYASFRKWGEMLHDARELSRIKLNARQLSDAHMIAQGAYSPLVGFMASSDYNSVVEHMHLAGGAPWPMPITLAVQVREQGLLLKEDDKVALEAPTGEIVGVLSLQERFLRDLPKEALNVYKTKDLAHPGVANMYNEGSLILGGVITMFSVPERDEATTSFYRAPVNTRQEFIQRGWKTVVGFQTRNPVHRAHEYIQKCALEIVDGLLLHPLVGETKSDDISAELRMRCYEALLDNYYPKDRALLSVFPAFMRYAGPREAVFHALCRRNYGCTHFIVGRDHAGVGNYYGPYDAQHIFKEFDQKALGITPLFFENAFYCRKCQGMASNKTCPHDSSQMMSISGTAVRAAVQKKEMLPPEFTRAEVAKILMEG